jgi:deoxyribodipyrimidine photo-lyase
VKPPVILWFQQDLRVQYQPALSAAVASGRPVVPVYILDQQGSGRWAPGGASRWWLHNSLASLCSSLEKLGSGLVLRRGPASRVLATLIAETGAESIFVTRRYESYAAGLECALAADFKKDGIEFRRFGGSLIFEPEALATKDGLPYKVFTPFYKACLARLPAASPAKAPSSIAALPQLPKSDRLADWALLPTSPDWAGGLRTTWAPGEQGAGARLDTFLTNAMTDYERCRDRPDKRGTSQISPHLHFGEISSRLCWQKIRFALEMNDHRGESGGIAFLRELIWREFSYHLLHHWPNLPEAPFRAGFKDFPWEENAANLQAWQEGRTGYPMVDAGMRQLWFTGWMHNRVRMVVASFLVKHLLIPWQAGAAWFWDTLVDADLANNSASWQWVAGCGADAAPYFRIFNPVIQGQKFDPDGAYVRQWVPELGAVPTPFIHQPWTAPPHVLADAGVVLGKEYPGPIVDHATARRRALDAFQQMKQRTI